MLYGKTIVALCTPKIHEATNHRFITTFAKGAKKVFVKKAPAILTGIGVAGGFAATISAVKATPKALRLIEEAEKEKGDSGEAVSSCGSYYNYVSYMYYWCKYGKRKT